MMKSSIKSILSIPLIIKLFLIINSCFVFSCSQIPEEQKSQALIDDFIYKEFYQNKTEWELKASKAEIFSSNRAKINDLTIALKAPQFPFTLQSKKGTLGVNGMTMQAPVSLHIPEYDLKMTLSQAAKWNRENQTFIGRNISLQAQSFQGTGQKMSLSYPYKTLQLSSVTFSFVRD